MTSIRTIACVGALSVTILIAGCSSVPAGTPSATPGANPSTTASPQLLAEGQQIYRTTGLCAACHGPAGMGTSLAPNLADDEWIWVRTTEPLRPQIVSIVRNGIPEPRQFGTPMPPMGGAQLSQQQIEAVSAYVESL